MKFISHDQMVTMVRNCEETMTLTIGEEQFLVQGPVVPPEPMPTAEPEAVEPSDEDNTDTDSA